MPGALTFDKHEQGWAATMPPDMAQAAGVAEGSIVVLHLEADGIVAEILPPVTEAMKQEVRDIAEQFKDLFAELKRRGD
jgi:antitoxin component of MazEF toxin-antitoxin module